MNGIFMKGVTYLCYTSYVIVPNMYGKMDGKVQIVNISYCLLIVYQQVVRQDHGSVISCHRQTDKPTKKHENYTNVGTLQFLLYVHKVNQEKRFNDCKLSPY